MIKVNNRDYPWRDGITVSIIMQELNYTFPKIYVKINNELIDKEEYSKRAINDGDDVKIIHLLAGG